MTLLTICKDACDSIGLQSPFVVATSPNTQDKSIFVLAKQALQFVCDSCDWQQLIIEGSITLATGTQTYVLPADFGRFTADTMWDRTNRRQQDFPVSSMEWAFQKGEGILTSLNRRARIQGNLITFLDTIAAVDNLKQIFFEYQSAYKALSGGVTPALTFVGDTDTARVPEYLVTLGVVWMMEQKRGIDYGPGKDQFDRALAKYQGFQKGSKALNMAREDFLDIGVTVKDRGYG